MKYACVPPAFTALLFAGFPGLSLWRPFLCRPFAFARFAFALPGFMLLPAVPRTGFGRAMLLCSVRQQH